MTFMLSVEEIQKFQCRLAEWHNQRTMAIAFGLGGKQQKIVKLANDFDEKHPRPDWKTLL